MKNIQILTATLTVNPTNKILTSYSIRVFNQDYNEAMINLVNDILNDFYDLEKYSIEISLNKISLNGKVSQETLRYYPKNLKILSLELPKDPLRIFFQYLKRNKISYTMMTLKEESPIIVIKIPNLKTKLKEIPYYIKSSFKYTFYNEEYLILEKIITETNTQISDI